MKTLKVEQLSILSFDNDRESNNNDKSGRGEII